MSDKSNALKDTYTFYVRAADGNVMAIYKKYYETYQGGYKEIISLEEQPIYGTSRIGERKESVVIDIKPHPATRPPLSVKTGYDNIVIAVKGLDKWGMFKVDLSGNGTTTSSAKNYFSGAPGKNLSIAEDKGGKYLFSVFTAEKYGDKANACVILNKNNEIMEGSTKIISDAQKKSLVMKKPGKTNEYYLLTIDNKGMPYYHVIDMGAKNGLGAITGTINKPLDTYGGYGSGMALLEDQTGTANSRLFLRKYERGGKCSIISFEITTDGIGRPQIMDTFKSNDSQGVGEMQISPDGKLLAIANPITKSINVRTGLETNKSI